MSRTCPECAQGKHVNCTGHTWDNDADCLTDCLCPECCAELLERDRERREEWWQ